jgi:hypothetical protein
MKYSPVFKCSIGILLALTLGLKFRTKPENLDWLRESTVRFLEDHNFHVVETELALQGMPILRASSGDCRLVLMRVSSLGWNRVMIRGIAEQGDIVFSVFNGKVYSEQPRWQSLLSYYWSKGLWELGLAQHTTYVLSVVASASCDAQSLPWRDLAAAEGLAS